LAISLQTPTVIRTLQRKLYRKAKERKLLHRRRLRPKLFSVRSSNQTRRCSTKPLKKLFARSLTQVFRPPGPDRRDSFFAGRCPPWTFRPGSAAPWQLTRRSSTVSAFLSNELIVMVAGGLPARPSSMTALISELDGDQTPPIASLPPGNSKSAPKLHSSVPT
jgi:hypothetical protein